MFPSILLRLPFQLIWVVSLVRRPGLLPVLGSHWPVQSAIPPLPSGASSMPWISEDPPYLIAPWVVRAAGGSMVAVERRATTPMRRVAPLHIAPPSVIWEVASRK